MRTNAHEEKAELMEAARRLDCSLLAEHLEDRETFFRRRADDGSVEAEDRAEEVVELCRQVARIQRACLALKAAQCRGSIATRRASVPHASHLTPHAGGSRAS